MQTSDSTQNLSQQMSIKPDHPLQLKNTSPDEDLMDLDDKDEEEEESDGEGEEGDGDAASRKKKGQRFFCTGYPPCNLSFTRSEHLARHIRKHTGERPFQCHCNRRFSRLDNLRQHAQTVHVNEEIPTDSLAATGTRFQRQIRTDRVRQGPRPRSGTMSSTGSHSRGHSRNLSASSIGSTSSNYSTVTEAKRRPPPLAMASDSSRPKLGIEPPSTPPAHYHGRPHSPGGMSTPTSATFSTAPGSPGYGSSFGSPMSTHSRVYGGSRTPGRRLSVPSGPNPFQNQHANPYQPQYGAHMGPPSSNSSANQSVFASPTSSTFNIGPGYHVPPTEDWRRRTWHPSTYTAPTYNYGRPATSGLLYSQTPDAPQPAYAQHATAAAGQAPRLPGIESFDHFQQRPTTPPRRQPSPMHTEQPPTKASMYPELDDHGHVRGVSWGQQAIEDIRRVGTQQGQPARSDMGPPPLMVTPQQQQQIAQEALQMHSSSKRVKRQGWYTGASAGQRTSPEDSSSSDGVPTPGTSAVDIHPMIVPSSGYMESQHSMLPPESQHSVSSYSQVIKRVS
jgi:C2H2 transcription facotor